MPTKVAPEEYDVYSAWLRHHFEKEPPGTLYLANRTFAPWSCTSNTRQVDGLDSSLSRQLRDLGEAQYPLKVLVKAIRIPWAFKDPDVFPYGLPTDKAGTYRLVAFSRVAFNARHTEALLAVSDSCGPLCGGGGMFLGRRKGGAWVFRQTRCIVRY